jgi:hypothetical protein
MRDGKTKYLFTGEQKPNQNRREEIKRKYRIKLSKKEQAKV